MTDRITKMKQMLKQDYQKQFDELNKTVRTLKDQTWELWCLIDGYHDDLGEIQGQADDVLESVEDTIDLIKDLYFDSTMLGILKQNE